MIGAALVHNGPCDPRAGMGENRPGLVWQSADSGGAETLLLVASEPVCVDCDDKRLQKGQGRATENRAMDRNDAGVSFLLMDLELANTFLEIAGTTKDDETRTRNIANAWKAHDTVRRFAYRLREPERSRVQRTLADLTKRLDDMG